MLQEEVFPCSLNRKQRISTNVAILAMTIPFIIAIIVLTLVAALGHQGPDFRIGAIITASGLGLVLAVMIVFLAVLKRFAPEAYLVGREGIAVLRRSGKKVAIIPAEELVSVVPVDAEDVRKGCMRTFGVGGYYGSWGSFYCTKLKSFQAYMTNANFTLLQTTRSGQFVLSPDTRDTFIGCVNALIASQGSRQDSSIDKEAHKE